MNRIHRLPVGKNRPKVPPNVSMDAPIFVVCKIYSLDEIERISGRKAAVNQLSYATIAATSDNDSNQYDFVFYPFSAGEGWTLIAVNGNLPPNSR